MKYDWDDSTDIRMTGSRGTKRETSGENELEVFFRPQMSSGDNGSDRKREYTDKANVKPPQDLPSAWDKQADQEDNSGSTRDYAEKERENRDDLTPPRYQSQSQDTEVSQKGNGGKKKRDIGPKGDKRITASIIAVVAVIMAVILTVCLCPCSHDWTAATCTNPSVCSRCNATSGTALGHKWKKTTEIDWVEAKEVNYSRCTTCDKKADYVTTQLETLLSENGLTFRITPTEFAKRLNAICARWELGVTCSWKDEIEALEGPGIEIKKNGDVVADVLLFKEQQGTLRPIQKNEKGQDEVYAATQIYVDRRCAETVDILIAFIVACDPALEKEMETVLNIIEASTNYRVACNDIVYSIVIHGDLLMLDVNTK